MNNYAMEFKLFNNVKFVNAWHNFHAFLQNNNYHKVAIITYKVMNLSQDSPKKRAYPTKATQREFYTLR